PGGGEAPDSLRLTTVAGEMRYILRHGSRIQVLDARTGEPLGPVDEAQAIASARQFASLQNPQYQRLVNEDAWTHTRSLDAHRPLHRLALDNGTLLYVSSQSGEVMRDASPKIGRASRRGRE